MVLKWTELPPPFIYRFYVDYSPVKETSQALIIILPIMCRFHSDGPNQGADYPGSQKRKEIKYTFHRYLLRLEREILLGKLRVLEQELDREVYLLECQVGRVYLQ